MRSIDTSVAIVYREGKFVIVDVKEDAELNSESIEEMYGAWNELREEGEKVLLVADIRSMWEASADARKLAASKEKTDNLAGIAIIVGGPATTMIANFFIKFNKPPIPVKLFQGSKEAKEWLLSL